MDMCELCYKKCGGTCPGIMARVKAFITIAALMKEYSQTAPPKSARPSTNTPYAHAVVPGVRGTQGYAHSYQEGADMFLTKTEAAMAGFIASKGLPATFEEYVEKTHCRYCNLARHEGQCESLKTDLMYAAGCYWPVDHSDLYVTAATCDGCEAGSRFNKIPCILVGPVDPYSDTMVHVLAFCRNCWIEQRGTM